MPPNENPKDDDGNPSSWFGSWFEGNDVRNEIHEQLNQFEKRKKRHEEAMEERRKFLEQQSSFPFPPFFGARNSPHRHRDESDREKENWEDFFGGPDKEPPHHPKAANAAANANNHRNEMEDLHREFQRFFESALFPTEDPRTGSRSFSSSSTTVVSNANGTSYRMQQDSRTGTRIDVQLPSHHRNNEDNSTTIAVEVLQEHPCVVQWRHQKQQHPNNKDSKRRTQALELGNAVDCSKLSATLAQNVLTLRAPPVIDGGENETSSPRNTRNGGPRPIPVSKTD
jgi:hypothetical protein